MSYQWAINPQELFAERYRQMVSGGLPADDVDEVSEAVGDMWADGPGGWVYEWSRLAVEYAEQRRHRLAAQAYGWAKFPTLADGARRVALARQLEQYLLAAPGFGIGFERRVLTVPYRDGTTAVPVHLLTPPDWSGDTPVLIASGGVDTWKMDLHTIFETFVLCTRMCVLAFDIPGTGESTVPMTDGASVVCGLVAEARGIGDGRVAHLGISMGGHFAARSGLAGEVDAAIVLGGPVEQAFAAGRTFAHGMRDIVGNALGFDHRPTDAELVPLWPAFDLRPLLDRDDNAPMLVINGADDVHVPPHDTLVFEGRRDTEVHLIPDTGHCAVTKLPEVIRVMFEWLERTLS
jgi:esterase FrsA